MNNGKSDKPRQNKVAIRVLIPRADYNELKRIAGIERSNVSSLVRRAVAHHFLIAKNYKYD